MAVSRDSSNLQRKCRSLLQAMLPIDADIQLSEENLMPTKFSESKHWKSLYILGPNQIQRNGLLFQAALSYATLGKQVTYVTKKQLNRFPPTTHGLPKMTPENMTNISFKYCDDAKQLGELLLGYSNSPVDILPDVIIVDALNEYLKQRSNLFEFHVAQMVSLLAETVEYLGQRKNSVALLFVSADLTCKEGMPVSWRDILKQWSHEVWSLAGNSNRLVSPPYQIQFTVLGPNIFLSSVFKQ